MRKYRETIEFSRNRMPLLMSDLTEWSVELLSEPSSRPSANSPSWPRANSSRLEMESSRGCLKSISMQLQRYYRKIGIVMNFWKIVWPKCKQAREDLANSWVILILRVAFDNKIIIRLRIKLGEDMGDWKSEEIIKGFLKNIHFKVSLLIENKIKSE